MTTLRLLNHHLLIQPPQHLLVIWITDQTSGAQITVSHVSGYVAEGMALCGTPARYAGSESFEQSEIEIPTPLPAGYLGTFPEVEEVDLWNLPAEYKAITNPHVDRYHLRPGYKYSVSLVGNMMVHATIVAE